MLKFLLDEYVPPAVAAGLRRLDNSIEVHVLRSWQGGSYLGQTDEQILMEAVAEGLTLVTYDLETIPRLLDQMARARRTHSGVIYISQKQIRCSDVGGLVKALEGLFQKKSGEDWTNRVEFLRRERE